MANRQLAVQSRYKTNSQVWTAVGMWAWVLHRVTGLAMVFYILLHTVLMGTSLIRGKEAFNSMLQLLMGNPVLKVMELLLVGAVIYHAINGIRLLLFDIGIGLNRQKEIFWAGMLVSGILWGWVIARMLH